MELSRSPFKLYMFIGPKSEQPLVPDFWKHVLCGCGLVVLDSTSPITTAVKSIKKQQLVEVRSMVNPPKMVKMAMESICLLIGEPTRDWKSIRSILIRENFIPTILSFSTEDITYVRPH